MKSGKLLVFALLGLGVLGYVVMELTSGGGDAPALKKRELEVPKTAQAPKAPKAPKVAGQKGAPKVVAPPVSLAPPPPPPPSMPPDEARKQWADYVEELERVKAEDRNLQNEEWTDLYKRGNDALEPMMRSLDSAVPDQAAEIDAAHLKFRTLIMELEPKAPPPSP